MRGGARRLQTGRQLPTRQTQPHSTPLCSLTLQSALLSCREQSCYPLAKPVRQARMRVKSVRLFCAHGPRWCLELELEPRLEPRGTGRQYRESGERRTCCLLDNRLSEMYIMSFFCDLDRENCKEHTKIV